jgi:hypothetical protein
MITVTIMGGLGNQLFQIFTTIAAALRNKDTFFFMQHDELPGSHGFSRYTYWSTLFRGLRKYLTPSTDVTEKMFQSLARWDEIGFHYTELPTETLKYTKPLRLHGYFQSYRYFNDNFAEICELIQLKQQQNWIKQIYGNESWSNEYIGNSNKKRILVSTHFRIGDYKHLSHIHPLMSAEYYYRAINQIISGNHDKNASYTFLVFYEPCDKETVSKNIADINRRCSTDINGPAYGRDIQFHFVRDTIVDWQQLLLMSVCDHNIIANSTFSWWGAYLNANPKKVVCYPSLWFAAGVSHDTRDMFPEAWKKINVNPS